MTVDEEGGGDARIERWHEDIPRWERLTPPWLAAVAAWARVLAEFKKLAGRRGEF